MDISANSRFQVAGRRIRLRLALPLLLAFLVAPAVLITLAVRGGGLFAQGGVFDSGSTGDDGALDLSGFSSGEVVEFFRDNAQIFPTAVDPEGDNIYHFTTINIPLGVTLKLSGEHIPIPVFWLASGAVQIDGTIDLNGENGHPACNFLADRACIAARTLSTPGAGGHAGGFGGSILSHPIGGFGPQGGSVGGGSASHGQNVVDRFAVPLLGGSGGAGSKAGSSDFIGNGGGAGGGALLIASSESISVNGSIKAEGGIKGSTVGVGCSGCGDAGNGAGGMIRLAAPVITGNGRLSAFVVRLEAFQDTCCNQITGSVFRATPFEVNLPDNNTIAEPSVRVVSIGGQDVPSEPTGTFETPDIQLDTDGEVTFEIVAQNIPVGTIVQLHIASEDSENRMQATANSTPLFGSFGSSTATATATLPRGFTQIYVEASWKP